MSIAYSNKFKISLPNREYFSDFLVNFDAHPDSMQIVRNINEKAIIRSIRNLLLTNKYERMFQPQIGCDIRNQLFEPMTSQSAIALQRTIETVIERYEPRAGLLEVIVTPFEEQNLYVVKITFFITNNQTPTSFVVQLSRAR